MITKELYETVKNNMDKINTIVGALLGIECNLKITDITEFENNITFDLIDNNIQIKDCGMFKKIFKKISIVGDVMHCMDGVRINIYLNPPKPYHDIRITTLQVNQNGIIEICDLFTY